MVGLSGGKDSWALMQVLDVLRRRAPVEFSLIAVNVDSGYAEYKHQEISRACEARGWEYRIEHTQIGEIMDDVPRPRRDTLLAVRQAPARGLVSGRHRYRCDQDCARTPRR